MPAQQDGPRVGEASKSSRMSSEPGETAVVRSIGRYRAFGELGRGAMGVVYRGFDPLIGRTVALKTISIDAADPQAREFRERLYREAAAAGALSHPNIVTIFDIIEDGGLTAVAMEFIEGRSLAAIIAERAPLPLDLAVEILDQIGSALDYAGSQGIVHRDIKPANILVTSAGRAKVTDFGVARLALSTMTQAGTVLGSPSYMSPEQVKGLSLDGRSDLFSAAVVFFEMITRERPFAGNDIATTMYRIAHEPPTPPNEFNPAVGSDVAAVLDRAFAKSPAARFQTGADLVASLRAAASLGSTRGVSGALAALATAPPPVPPIVAPITDVAAADSEARRGMAPLAAPTSVSGAGSTAPAGSGGHALAPIPGTGLPSAPSAPGPVSSGVELPAIPLPPKASRPAGPRPAGAATPPATPGRGRGLARAAVMGAVVVALGVAGMMYLRGGSPFRLEQPPAVAPPIQPATEPAGAAPPPDSGWPPLSPPPAPAPSAAPAAGAPAATRGAAGSARGQAASQGRTGARPLPSQPVAAAPPADASQVPSAPAAPVANAPSARVYLATELDTKPEVLTQVAPNYPDEAAQKNVQDVVVLQVLVDASGRPQTIKLLRGSRKAPLLDGAAAAAVRQWTFSPARKDGQAVPSWFNVGVPFPPAK
jgi:serine/threonine-protein kinase